MSRLLVASVPKGLTDYLESIDEEAVRPGSVPLDISRGPFNVFAATPRLAASPQPALLPDQTPFLFDDGDVGFLCDRNDMSLPGSWDTDLDLELDTFLTASAPQEFHEPSSHTLSTTSRAAHETQASDIIEQSVLEPETERFYAETALLPLSSAKDPPLFPASSSSIPCFPDTANCRDMQSMLFLINHFTTTIVTYLTPWRHEKTPWHILFVPQMRECAALLMLNTPMSHADEAIFYGFSAITALSIGGACCSQMWLDKGETYREKSYNACQVMLQRAYDTPKKYKYKRILMALLVAVLMSTLKGDPVTEEYYFLEAEKLIKLRGLGRKNSRKVRMLHRFYAYERLLYESTCMRGIDFKHRRRVTNDVNSVSIIAYPDDNMAFRVPDWASLGKRDAGSASSEQDSDESTEKEILGLWPDTLCAKVAGIPEQWILVLLHTVLLGKHKDAVEQAGRSDTEHLQEFHSRAKALEKCMQKQVLQVDLATIPSSLTGREVPGEAWLDVLDCFRHALHIYFYRRIYDVPSLWLQDKVDKSRQCLARILQGYLRSGDLQFSGSVGVLWASFIASCEAEGQELQGFFADWYRQAASKTGISTWLNSLSLSQQIWSTKRTEVGRKTTWIDVLREQQRDFLHQMPPQAGVMC
jgi:hypothetical protein